MSKIISIARSISTIKNIFPKILPFKLAYGFSRNTDQQAKRYFENIQPQKEEKPSFFGQGAIDHLTKEQLVDYNKKMKQIRDEHNGIEKQIKAKYDSLIKEATKTHRFKRQPISKKQQSPGQQDEMTQRELLDEAIEDVKMKRFDQIFNNKAVMKHKIDKLTTQYSKNFAKARKQYQLDYIKKYMLENMKQLKEEPSQIEKLLKSQFNENQSGYIPNSLVIKKLYFKTKDGKERQILLTGIEQNDEDHSAYLKTLIEKLKIKHVLTMMPPDMPYFIKTQTSFSSEWMQFLKAPTPKTKFYLNPNAKTLNDITLNRSFIPHVLYGMTKSKSFYQTAFSLMQMNETNFKYEHQPLYSGLIAATVENVYFCDYPFLKERQMIALNMKLSDLRQLAKQHAYYKQAKKENFSAELLLPKNVVQKKFRHIFKLAKTIALITQSSPILICDASIAQVMSEEWKKSPLEFMQFDYAQNTYLLDMELYKVPNEEVLFLEFIEKLVILDIILEPLIQKYFVKYDSFPYSCKNTVGGKQNLTKVFLLWRHFYNIYNTAITGKNERLEKSQNLG